jgi:hypothetical protein
LGLHRSSSACSQDRQELRRIEKTFDSFGHFRRGMTLRSQTQPRLRRGMMLYKSPPALILFLTWTTSGEHKWITLAERLSCVVKSRSVKRDLMRKAQTQLTGILIPEAPFFALHALFPSAMSCTRNISTESNRTTGRSSFAGSLSVQPGESYGSRTLDTACRFLSPRLAMWTQSLSSWRAS